MPRSRLITIVGGILRVGRNGYAVGRHKMRKLIISQNGRLPATSYQLPDANLVKQQRASAATLASGGKRVYDRKHHNWGVQRCSEMHGWWHGCMNEYMEAVQYKDIRRHTGSIKTKEPAQVVKPV